jgi:hypothetical protein
VDAPQQTNAAITGKLSPAIAGATIKFRATHPNGTVTTQSAVTNSTSSWGIKIPITSSDFGTVKIETFFDGEGKYGPDNEVCTVPVF